MTIKFALFFCMILCSTQSLLCMQKRPRTTKGEQIKKPEKKRSTTTTPIRYSQAVARMATRTVPLELSLHHVESMDPKKLKMYLAAGVDVHEVVNGETPLHKFVRARNNDGIQKLLLYGASIAVANGDGDSSLHMSARTLPDIARLLLTSPQGSPSHVTPEIEVWKKSLICFSCVLNRLSVPRDVRLIICKQMTPEPHQLIKWVPLHAMPFYLNFYSEQEKRRILDLLVKRHVVDIFQALRTQNRNYQTPFQVALTYVGRMGIFFPPVHILDRNHSGRLQPEIRANYAKLLGLP